MAIPSVAKAVDMAAANYAGDATGCGAIAGSNPGSRVNRIHMQLEGLGRMMTLFRSAIYAPPDRESTPLVWEAVLNKVGMDIGDLQAEVSTLWDELRAVQHEA